MQHLIDIPTHENLGPAVILSSTYDAFLHATLDRSFLKVMQDVADTVTHRMIGQIHEANLPKIFVCSCRLKYSFWEARAVILRFYVFDYC